jgi:hypothetical protein
MGDLDMKLRAFFTASLDAGIFSVSELNMKVVVLRGSLEGTAKRKIFVSVRNQTS